MERLFGNARAVAILRIAITMSILTYVHSKKNIDSLDELQEIPGEQTFRTRRLVYRLILYEQSRR